MCCYYNLGFDAKVASDFEKMRSKHRFVNHLAYAYLGLKGALCSSNLIRVKDFLEGFTELK